MSSVRPRVRILFLLCLGAWLVVIGKMYYVQVVVNDRYVALADRQHQRPAGGLFDRGEVFLTTKDGEHVAAATNRQGFVLYISPKDIKDPAATFDALVGTLPDLNREEFIARASKPDDPYEEVARRVTQDQYEKIAALEKPGVGFTREAWRFYPGESLAAHVVGFVSRGDDDRIVGRYGLERKYEETLKRDEGEAFVNFFVELFSGVKKVVTGEGKRGDVYTTIEPTVQARVEDIAQGIVTKYSAQEVGVIVMDPRDGTIFAMASTPTYDPNKFNDVGDYGVYKNPLVESLYEMGSIIKPITMAIGLDKEAITPSSTFEDRGSLTLDGRTFFNFDKKVRGVVDMQAVLDNSLNTGVAYIVSRLGNQKFADSMRVFLGKESTIDLPNEASPQVENLKSPRNIEYATASFGQGIAITPIATIRALAALGNGGVMVTPHVVSEVEYEGGSSEKFLAPNELPRAISARASEDVTRMLVRVVDNALLGGTMKKADYAVAAKTGTAQMSNPDGGYYEDKYLHSFFGYFPAYQPRFIVLIYAIDPRGEQYASHTLTEPFFELTDFLIDYYSVPPDRPTEPEENQSTGTGGAVR